jgi:Zn ribbon nucleic-acid-binding protein
MLQKLRKLFAGKPKEPQKPQCENNDHMVVFLEGVKHNYLICTKCGWKQIN